MSLPTWENIRIIRGDDWIKTIAIKRGIRVSKVPSSSDTSLQVFESDHEIPSGTRLSFNQGRILLQTSSTSATGDYLIPFTTLIGDITEIEEGSECGTVALDLAAYGEPLFMVRKKLADTTSLLTGTAELLTPLNEGRIKLTLARALTGAIAQSDLNAKPETFYSANNPSGVDLQDEEAIKEARLRPYYWDFQMLGVAEGVRTWRQGFAFISGEAAY